METETKPARLPVPAGRIERVSNGYVLAFDRQFDYPRAHIWNLLVDPAKLAQWLGRLTPGWEQGKEYSLDLGGGAVVSGTVLLVNAPTTLQISWEDELGDEAVIEWRVLESNAGTLLQFRSTAESADFLAEGSAGWQSLLAGLEQVAAGREPAPDPREWEALRDAYSREFSISQSMGTVVQVSGHPALRFDRLLAAPPAKVWQALTEPAELARWLAPTELQLQAGGTIRIDFASGQVSGDVGYVLSERALDYSWSSPDVRESSVHWALDTHDGGTLLKFTHVLRSEANLPALLAAWHQHLDGLAEVLDGQGWRWSAARYAALKAFYVRMQP